MSDGTNDVIIACALVHGANKGDAEEFAECFGAKLVSFDAPQSGRSVARFAVPAGDVARFVEYAEDDSMIRWVESPAQ